MNKLKKTIHGITYLLLGLTMFSAFAVSLFIRKTTEIICEGFQASDFLKNVNALPWRIQYMTANVCFCICILLVSFLIREYMIPENTKVFSALILMEFLVAMAVVIFLDFNYNGILLWVFANIISHTKKGAGQYVFTSLGLVSYALTDYGILAVSRKLFSVQDYISIYDPGVQPVLIAIYNILVSINMLVFIL